MDPQPVAIGDDLGRAEFLDRVRDARAHALLAGVEIKQRLERSFLRDGHVRFEFYFAHVPTAGDSGRRTLRAVPDGVLNSVRARIMSGVAHLVERHRLDFGRLTAEIAAEFGLKGP